jgi:hypothetical protein
MLKIFSLTKFFFIESSKSPYMCKMSTLFFLIGTEEDVRGRETLEKNLKWKRESEREGETSKINQKMRDGEGN